MLYAVNGFGNTIEYALTVYSFYGWIDPIYDRIQWDLDHNTSKAFLNHYDLNRIETNCKFLADTLNGYGYSIDITTKTDWNRTDLPYLQSGIERITSNIQALEAGYYILGDTPSIPSDLGALYYYKVNDIEKILFDMKSLIDLMVQSFRYCGTLYSGGAVDGLGDN